MSFNQNYHQMDDSGSILLQPRSSVDSSGSFAHSSALGLNHNNISSTNLLEPQSSSTSQQISKKTRLKRKLKRVKDSRSKFLRGSKVSRFRMIVHDLGWSFLFASLAAVSVFWFPNFFWYRVNMSYMILNVSGAFIVAIVSRFEQIKHQFPQTYLMYDGIKSGFCSVLTTFGNLIEDFQFLLRFDPIWPAFFHLIGTLTFSFISYRFGWWIAGKWKPGSKFSYAMAQLENQEIQIEHAIEIQLAEQEAEAQLLDDGEGDSTLFEDENQLFVEDTGLETSGLGLDDNAKDSLNILKSSLLSPVMKVYNQRQQKKQQKRVKQFASKLPSGKRQDPGHEALGEFETKDYDSKAEFRLRQYVSPVELDYYYKQQLLKGSQHLDSSLQQHHMRIIYSISFIVILCWIMALTHTWRATQSFEAPHTSFSFLVAFWLSVSGALIGGYLGRYEASRFAVNWGTFKNNLVSCFLIAIAHNILLFRYNFPGGNFDQFPIFWRHFISDFCGSESNYAGLIDETYSLWRQRVSNKVPVLNITYNVFITLFAFLVTSYYIRVAVFVSSA